jgi:hypothetical protein
MARGEELKQKALETVNAALSLLSDVAKDPGFASQRVALVRWRDMLNHAAPRAEHSFPDRDFLAQTMLLEHFELILKHVAQIENSFSRKALKREIAVLLACLAVAGPDESEALIQEPAQDESYESTDDDSPEMEWDEPDENEDFEDMEGPGGGNPI